MAKLYTAPTKQKILEMYKTLAEKYFSGVGWTQEEIAAAWPALEARLDKRAERLRQQKLKEEAVVEELRKAIDEFIAQQKDAA